MLSAPAILKSATVALFIFERRKGAAVLKVETVSTFIFWLLDVSVILKSATVALFDLGQRRGAAVFENGNGFHFQKKEAAKFFFNKFHVETPTIGF